MLAGIFWAERCLLGARSLGGTCLKTRAVAKAAAPRRVRGTATPTTAALTIPTRRENDRLDAWGHALSGRCAAEPGSRKRTPNGVRMVGLSLEPTRHPYRWTSD